MKKALAIISAVALVSFAAFAQDAAAAATASSGPVVTGGIDVTAEVNLAKGNTVAVGKDGTAATATDPALTSKGDAVGLNATRFKTIDWAQFDWEKASIKVEGRYDAYKANGDDWSYLKTTSTWKDFFGFAIKHEFAVDNKELGDGKTTNAAGQTGIVDFTQAKNFTNKVSASIAKDAVKFSAEYDADDIFGIMNILQTGDKIEQIFTGFRNVSFEYDNDEVYAKLVYKNVKENNDILRNDKTTAQGKFETAAIDAAIIEAKNMFGVWTARFNDAAETKLRLANLDSDGKTDKFEYVIGKDLKIQEATADDVTTVGKDESKKNALNVLNTIKPNDGLTIKLQTVVPTNKSVAFGDWLKGTYYGTEPDQYKDSTDKRVSNFAFDVSYALANVGTINAGSAIQQDYVVSDGVVQGLSRYFSYDDVTGLVGNSAAGMVKSLLPAPVTTGGHWGTAVWADAKLDKLLGEDGKKAIYVAFDTQFGEYLDKKATYDSNATDPTKLKVYTSKGLTRSGLNLEAKLANLDGNDKLTVAAGTAIRFGSGYDYKANNTNLATGVGATWDETFKPTGYADAAYVNNWSEANWVYKNVYAGGKDFSPFELKVSASYALNDTFKKVYVKNEYKALANDITFKNKVTAPATPVAVPFAAGAKMVGGWADKNVITLGTDLGVTKNGTLNVEGAYNLFLGLPTADQLYATGATDAQKKVIKAAAESYYGSGDFSPINLKVSYSIKF